MSPAKKGENDLKNEFPFPFKGKGLYTSNAMKTLKNKLHEKFGNITYGEALIGLLIALCFIVYGSFQDLSFARHFVKLDNPFGKIVSYLGPLPGYAIFGSVGVCFLINWDQETQKDSKFLAWACCIIFPLLAGSLYGYEVFADVISNKYLAALIGIALVGACDVLIYFLCRGGDKEEAYTVGITILFASVTVLILMYLLKKAGLRPRYLFLAEQGDLDGAKYFRPWWAFDASVKESFPNADSSLFESWPSGHAALSSLSVLGVLYCRLNKKLENKTTYFIFGSYLFAFLIDLGRVSDGHHYVSDVAFGSFFALLFAFLIVYLVYLPAPLAEEESEEKETKSVFVSNEISRLRNSPYQKKKAASQPGFVKDKKKPLSPRKKAYRLHK